MNVFEEVEISILGFSSTEDFFGARRSAWEPSNSVLEKNFHFTEIWSFSGFSDPDFRYHGVFERLERSLKD